jgi:hypothetical protein
MRLILLLGRKESAILQNLSALAAKTSRQLCTAKLKDFIFVKDAAPTITGLKFCKDTNWKESIS